jgi:hypothetical protein
VPSMGRPPSRARCVPFSAALGAIIRASCHLRDAFTNALLPLAVSGCRCILAHYCSCLVTVSKQGAQHGGRCNVGMRFTPSKCCVQQFQSAMIDTSSASGRGCYISEHIGVDKNRQVGLLFDFVGVFHKFLRYNCYGYMADHGEGSGCCFLVQAAAVVGLSCCCQIPGHRPTAVQVGLLKDKGARSDENVPLNSARASESHNVKCRNPMQPAHLGHVPGFCQCALIIVK